MEDTEAGINPGSLLPPLPVHSDAQKNFNWIMADWVKVRDNQRLRLAMAMQREGHSSNPDYYPTRDEFAYALQTPMERQFGDRLDAAAADGSLFDHVYPGNEHPEGDSSDGGGHEY